MPLGRSIANVVTISSKSSAAKDAILAVRSLISCQQTELIRTVSDQVILPQITKDQVIAAVALNIVVAIFTRPFAILLGDQATTNINRHVAIIINRRTISLNRIVTQLSENHIIVGATCNRIIPRCLRQRIEDMIIEIHLALGSACGIDLSITGDLSTAVRIVYRCPNQHLHPRTDRETSPQ